MSIYAGIYARVSVEHGNRKDMTIDNQILLAKNFIKENNIADDNIVDNSINCYIDKGYSGMNFKRPGFIKLMSDIMDNKLNILIVKDFSRIGRNYIETGEYIEKIFPMYNVRFIAISEGYDSIKSSSDTFIMGIKNIINEWYAKEAGRKVSLSKQYQKKNGGYVGSYPPYGYKVENNNGFRVLKEADTMAVVKQMKSMHEHGYTSKEVAAWLKIHRINMPAVYNKTGMIYCPESEEYKVWDAGSVRRLW